MRWGMGRRTGWRIALSIILFFGFITFIIVWLFFYADGFSLAQNVAIFLLAVLVFGGLRAAAWGAMWRRWGRRREAMVTDRTAPSAGRQGKYCADCGTLNPLDASYCVSCGKEFLR